MPPLTLQYSYHNHVITVNVAHFTTAVIKNDSDRKYQWQLSTAVLSVINTAAPSLPFLMKSLRQIIDFSFILAHQTQAAHLHCC